MMELKLVEKMDQQPGCCLICLQTPTESGKVLPAIHAVGMDVNWGDSVYICSRCVNIMADLFDRISPEKHEAEMRRNKMLQRQLKKSNAELAKVQSLVDRMLEGARARKEAKEAKNA